MGRIIARRAAASSVELMQLRMLAAAADEGSLQRAAERVGRTPQALSSAIAKLEQGFGVAMLDRAAGRGCRLTTAGEILVDHARRILSLLDDAAAAVDEIRSVRHGHLRIGANQSIGEYLLPRLMEAFRRRYPAVKIKVSIGYSDAIVANLKRRQLDLALVASRRKDKTLQGQLLMTDRLVAIMNPRHALAMRDVVDIDELAGYPLILLTEPSELRERVVDAFRGARISVNPHVETDSLDALKQMALHEMGIGIVPRLSVSNVESAIGLTMKTIVGFGEDRALWLLHPKSVSPVARAFMAVVRLEVIAPS